MTLTLRLAFDPTAADKEVQAVFVDEIARSLWLLWKGMWKHRHLTNQHFNKDCLAVAACIRKLEPRTGEELRACFTYFTDTPAGFSNFTSGDVDVMLLSMVPYLCGTNAEREPVMYEIDG